MITKKFIWSIAIVSLSIVNSSQIIINKHDYTRPDNFCQQKQEYSTFKYNYITTEKLIEHNIYKYQKIKP
jgi:hypothetical protein